MNQNHLFPISFSVVQKNKEHEELRRKMDETSSLIEATDAAIAKANTENHVLETELKATLREHERQTKVKTELEEKILEVLQDHISSDQAGRARARNVRELQSKRREREQIMFTTEEQLSKLMYELEKLKGIVAGNRAQIDEIMVEEKLEFYYGCSSVDNFLSPFKCIERENNCGRQGQRIRQRLECGEKVD